MCFQPFFGETAQNLALLGKCVRVYILHVRTSARIEQSLGLIFLAVAGAVGRVIGYVGGLGCVVSESFLIVVSDVVYVLNVLVGGVHGLFMGNVGLNPSHARDVNDEIEVIK